MRTATRLMTLKEKAQIVRVLAATYEWGASGYYRIVLPLFVLQAQGRVEAVWRDLLGWSKDDNQVLRDPMARKLANHAVAWSNVLLMERENRTSIMLPLLAHLKKSGKSIIMDIDDDIEGFTRVPYAPVAEYWQANIGGFLSVMHSTDMLIASTDKLAERYGSYLNNGKVAVIDNYIDTQHPRWQCKPQPHDKIIIGWMGGRTHIEDVALLEQPIHHILNKYDVVFKIVGLHPEWVDRLPLDRVIIDADQTDLEEYPKHFADFDIGLIPLVNNDFNRVGKSSLKFLEYSMFRIASIATDITPYRSCIRNKRSGLLVRTPEDWINSMSYLIEHETARKAMGDAAYVYTTKYRNIYDNAYRWADAFRDARKLTRNSTQRSD